MFTHRPLDPTQKQIRVLQILPGEAKSLIRCTIKNITLKDDHVCLSYTWGTASSCATIELNGQPFRVQPNLFEFLNRARRDYCHELLWIDAISIDQESISERNHQVQQMAAIYRQAKYVLVWAGPLPDVLKDAATTCSRLPDLMRPRSNRVVRNFLFRAAMRTKPEWQKALTAFLQHDYLRRTWTIQEIHLARQSLLILQNGTVEMKHVLFLYLALESGISYIQSISSLRQSHLRQHAILVTDYRAGDYLRRNPPNKGDLFNYARDFAMMDCSEPLDRIYALLGMSTLGAHIDVDYNRDKTELLYHVLKRTHGKSGHDFRFAVAAIGRALRLLNIVVCCHEIPPWAQEGTQLQRPSFDIVMVTFDPEAADCALSMELKKILIDGLRDFPDRVSHIYKAGMIFCSSCSSKYRPWKMVWGWPKFLFVGKQHICIATSDVSQAHQKSAADHETEIDELLSLFRNARESDITRSGLDTYIWRELYKQRMLNL